MNISQKTHLQAPSEEWQPVYYPADSAEARSKVHAIIESGLIQYRHETIRNQLEELIVCRHPADKDKLDTKQKSALVDEHLKGIDIEEYGTWVFFPWSGRLVHVLPEAEFREVRTSRNCHLITPREQDRLAAARVGIVGLSVGRAVLTTMAREGIGRTYRLADFDRLELSNMNRLHAAVHDLGIPKVVLAAREILEMDPYIDVKIFPTGLNESNLHEFMDIDGRIDLLIEECDDLFAKVLIREQARNRGIPVLMSTSDRGLIDVERFDREPERPVFHNLLSGVDAKTLQTLSTKDKVPYVLDTLGSDLVSDRMLSSLLEVGETLVTWPQLASSVALGGAVIADVARRILLGQMNASGRFYVDVAELVSDSTAWTPECPDRSGQNAMNWTGDSEIIHGASAAIVPQASGQLSQEEIRTLVSYAVSAPSGGNSQPWRFVARGSELDCYRDTTRSGSVLDFRGWFSNLAIGAAIENLHLAAAAMGIQTWGEMSRGNL